jgi:Mrp family chromosome partitioning ATPase/capsular polysaccharide biosynthesis protein
VERVSAQEPTSLSTYLWVLRRRAWIVVLYALVAGVVAYELTARQPPRYASSAEVYISQQNISAALAGINSVAFGSEALAVDTQAVLADVPSVAARALRIAKLHGRTPEQLLHRVTITPDKTTNVLTISVVDASPVLSKLLATSYAKAFTVYSNRLQAQPILRARHQLEAAMTKLAAEGHKSSPLYVSLGEKDEQLQTLQTLGTSRAVLARPAEGAIRIAPHPNRNVALGLVLGLVLGLGVAFGLEAIDTRVRSVAELIEGIGGLPLLARTGPLPAAHRGGSGLVMLDHPDDPAAEAFRVLRTNLDLVRLAAGEMRTIIVTSASTGEGKSTTAANLAVAEARGGRSVALVDLDLRRPSIARLFELRDADGVTDVARGTTELGSALREIDLRLDGFAPPRRPAGRGGRRVTAGGSLRVLVSGPLPPDPGEFAVSYRVAEMIEELRSKFDLVVIDTPPLLWVGDALTLSSQADGLIVVTRLKGLKRGTLRELRRVLEVVPARKLGFVVTGPVPGERAGYQDYRVEYGYGSSSAGRRDRRGGETVGTAPGEGGPDKPGEA